MLRPGLVRRLSAGRGLRHAERNPAAWSPCRYLEMWVLPEAAGLDPGVEVADVSRLRTANGLVRVASGAGHPGAVTLQQPGAVLWAGRLGPGEPAEVPDGPHVHLFVAVGGGVLDTGGLAGAGHLVEGDSARLVAAGAPVFTAGPSGAELLVWQTT